MLVWLGGSVGFEMELFGARSFEDPLTLARERLVVSSWSPVDRALGDYKRIGVLARIG